MADQPKTAPTPNPQGAATQPGSAPGAAAPGAAAPAQPAAAPVTAPAEPKRT